MVLQQPSPGKASATKRISNRGREGAEQSPAVQIDKVSRFARNYCRIPHKLMAVVFVDEDDRLCTIATSPRQQEYFVPPHVEAQFENVVRYATQEHGFVSYPSSVVSRAPSPSADDERIRGSHKTNVRKRAERVAGSASKSRRMKKRRQIKAAGTERRASIKEEIEDDDSDRTSIADYSIIASDSRCRDFRIDDTVALERYYYERFEQIQQKDCKTITKAWIKMIHPKKQSNNPYVKGWEARPDWWPSSGCDHTEPDHLIKDQRIHLMKWILGLDASFAPIAKLEKATSRLEHKIKKHALLKEVYRIAKKRQQYCNEELDGDSIVHVAASPKSLVKPEDLQGGSDDEEGVGESDSDYEDSPPSPASTTLGTSQIVAPVSRITLGEKADRAAPVLSATPDPVVQRTNDPPPARPKSPPGDTSIVGMKSNSNGGYQHTYEHMLIDNTAAEQTSLNYQQNGSFSSTASSLDYITPSQQMYSSPRMFRASHQPGPFGADDDLFTTASSQSSFSQPNYPMVPQEHDGPFSDPMMMIPSPQLPQQSAPPLRAAPTFVQDAMHQSIGPGMVEYSAQVPAPPYSGFLSTNLSQNNGFVSYQRRNPHLENVKVEAMNEQ